MHTCLPILLLAHLPAQGPHQYFRINVVDEQTGRGVPLVELRSVNGITLYTDSAGVVAFQEPGLMDKDVFFHVSSHGYELAKDGFGYRGKSLRIKVGAEATLKIKRINIAERLYRITGAGIYRYSEAAEAYDAALGLDPNNGDWWFNLGLLHKAARDFGAGLAANQRARALLGERRGVL